MDLIDHAAGVLRSFDIEPNPLDRLLAAYLERHRGLGAASRRLLSDVVFGVTRWRLRLDVWLRECGIRKPDARARALCYLVWKELGGPQAPGYRQMAMDLGIDRRPEWDDRASFKGRDFEFWSYPDFLYSKFVDAFGERGADEMARSLNETSRPVLRVNSLRSHRDEAIAKLRDEGIEASPTKISPYGIVLEKRSNVAGTKPYRDGLIEFQDEGSQIATVLANPGPGGTVLDACAGAGGKSLMLAMLMKNEGRVFSTDRDDRKLKELRWRAKRAGAACIDVHGMDRMRGSRMKGGFDVVLIDAPCTGTGTLRRSPDIRWRITPDVICARAHTQLELMHGFEEWVRPGGRLVYLTCSILPEENEDVVAKFLEESDYRKADVGRELERCDLSPKDVVGRGGFLWIDPRHGDWDGFFGAVLERP